MQLNSVQRWVPFDDFFSLSLRFFFQNGQAIRLDTARRVKANTALHTHRMYTKINDQIGNNLQFLFAILKKYTRKGLSLFLIRSDWMNVTYNSVVCARALPLRLR